MPRVSSAQYPASGRLDFDAVVCVKMRTILVETHYDGTVSQGLSSILFTFLFFTRVLGPAKITLELSIDTEFSRFSRDRHSSFRLNIEFRVVPLTPPLS